MRALFVDTHQSTVADDVRDHDGGQPAFQGWSIHADHLTFVKEE